MSKSCRTARGAARFVGRAGAAGIAAHRPAPYPSCRDHGTHPRPPLQSPRMSISALPLSYCTNVHAGRSVAEVEAGLDRYTVAVRDRFGEPLAAGLWLARPVTHELTSTPDGLARFGEGLRRRGLTCHTLNAFPYGDFHGERVKENVYLPDWSQPARRDYTKQCAVVLALLLPEGATEGSISTLPLGFKGFPHDGNFVGVCVHNLLDVAHSLAGL